ncbi:DnaJ domain-containing protein, partial [Candidatus Woesebacteria bacterium]|nr:DnaJ domain-containing protein [Candidatus Woesebacteria bacterium]
MAAQSKTEEKFINYYELLSVPRDAGIKQIQEAYRRLAKEYQDVFQIAPQDFQKLSPEEKFVFEKRTREMQDISNAYGILRNPSTRTVYDRGLDQYLKSQPKPERPIIRTEDIVPREYPGTPTEPVGPEFQIKAPVEERPVFQKLPEAPYQKPAQVTGQVTTPQIAAKQKEPGIAGSAAKQLAGAGAKKVATQAAGKIAAGTAAKAAATRAISALGGPVGLATGLVISLAPAAIRKGKELVGGALAWASSGASTFGGAFAAGISTIALPSLIPVVIAIVA